MAALEKKLIASGEVYVPVDKLWVLKLSACAGWL